MWWGSKAGWLINPSWAAPARQPEMLVELVLVKLPLVKLMVILVATVCERLEKAARPLEAVAKVVPCSAPLPTARVAVTAVPPSGLPLAALHRLPNWSWMRTTGCWAKVKPAEAVAEGWICSPSPLAAPAISRNVPKLETPLVTPAMLEVPDLVS